MILLRHIAERKPLQLSPYFAAASLGASASCGSFFIITLFLSITRRILLRDFSLRHVCFSDNLEELTKDQHGTAFQRGSSTNFQRTLFYNDINPVPCHGLSDASKTDPSPVQVPSGDPRASAVEVDTSQQRCCYSYRPWHI